MKCMFECAHVSMCLRGVECEENVKEGKQTICSGGCSKCSFESVCTINKSKRKVGKKN